jgi:hypothetical protein
MILMATDDERGLSGFGEGDEVDQGIGMAGQLKKKKRVHPRA